MSFTRPLMAIIMVCLLAACGTMQSIVRSSVPYTATLTVAASTKTGENITTLGTATSFDNVIFKNGENVNRINAVKVISADLKSALPADFDLGHIKTLKIYMIKGDESDAVLVASKDNVVADAGNIITLDPNTSALLDRFIREPDIRIKMIYTLRSAVPANASVMLVMKFTSTPVNNN